MTTPVSPSSYFGSGKIPWGKYSKALGVNSIALGDYATTSSLYSIAIGSGDSSNAAKSTGEYGISIGHNAISYINNISVGNSAGHSVASGEKCIFIGKDADGGNFNNQIAIGEGATCTGTDSVAIGLSATAGAGEYVFGKLNLSSTGLTANRTISFPDSNLNLATPTFTTSISLVRNGETLVITPSPINAGWTFTFPTTAGTDNYFLKTNGSGVTSWAPVLATGGSFSDTDFDVHDSIDTTKIARFECTNITTGTTRIMTFPDRNLNLATPTFTDSVSLSKSAQTLVLGAAIMDTGYTWTFPTSGGTANYLLQTNGSGETSWTGTPTLDTLLIKTSLSLEDTDSGTNKITLQASAALTSDYSITLPDLLPTTGKTAFLDITSLGASTWNTIPYDSYMTGFVAWINPAGTYWSYARPVLTITYAGYGYIRGKKVSWTAGKTVNIVPNAENFIVVPAEDTVSRVVFDDSTMEQTIILFSAYDDGTTLLLKKEQHHVKFNASVSDYLHDNIGSVVTGSGGVISAVTSTSGATQSDVQLKITGAEFADHGVNIIFNNINPISFSVMYLNGSSNWVFYSSSVNNIPLFYNGASGTMTPIGAGNRGVFRVYGTMDNQNSSTPQFILVANQTNATTSNPGVFTTLNSANSAISSGIISQPTYPLTSMEFIQLGYVVVRNSGTYGYIEQITIQKSTINQQYVGGGTSASHITLSDLNAGQYFDGAHQNMATRRVATAYPVANNDDSGTGGAPGNKTLSLWLDNTNSTNPDVYINTVNTVSAAVWPQLITGLASDTNSNLRITPTAITTTFRSNLTGTQNTLIGKLAGSAITSGIGNTCIGYNNMSAQTAGQYNLVAGWGSATSINNLNSINNIVLGKASFTAVTDASDCIVIGSNAANSITLGVNSIIIGKSADGGNYSNQIAIGESATCTSSNSIAIGKSASAGYNDIVIGSMGTSPAVQKYKFSGWNTYVSTRFTIAYTSPTNPGFIIRNVSGLQPWHGSFYVIINSNPNGTNYTSFVSFEACGGAVSGTLPNIDIAIIKTGNSVYSVFDTVSSNNTSEITVSKTANFEASSVNYEILVHSEMHYGAVFKILDMNNTSTTYAQF